jgi:CheY-like chemotaxis protein
MSGQASRNCILIVEDDPELRASLADLLQDEGYQVAGAANGQEALKYLSQWPAPCLILLDLMMPVMNGWEFREKQQQDPALAAIPVAVVTGVRDGQRQMQTLNAVGYFQKPVDLPALLETVAHFC